MHPSALPAIALLALDGESAAGNGTGIAVIALLSIVVGYLLLAALWYFVFRGKARFRRDRDPGE